MTEPVTRLIFLSMTLFGAMLLMGLVGVLAWPVADGVQPCQFEQAAQCVEAAMADSYDRAGLTNTLHRPLATTQGCWRQIELPAYRPAEAATFQTGTLLIHRVWFRLHYVVPDDWITGNALMLYVPRVMGAAWQVRVDGDVWADNLDDWRMTWNRPLDVQLKAAHVRSGERFEILIGVVYADETGFAIARPMIGPAGQLGRILARRQFWQLTMPQAGTAVMLLLGAFFFSFWLVRRTDREYLLLALTSLGWSVCNLQYTLPRWDDPQLDAWYTTLVQELPIPWLNWLVFLFATHLANRHIRWLDRFLPIYVMGISIMALPLWSANQNAVLLVAAMYTLVGIISIATICWLAVVSRNIELRVIGVVLFLAAFAGANDLALTAHLVDPARLYLVPYCGLLLFASFLYAVRRRYLGAIKDHEQLSADLARRLAQREDELTRHHLRLREFERAETLAVERRRLMRDMHDGFGSTLASSLAVIERGEVRPNAIANLLRDCVDDLRAVIDSLEPIDHDLVALLAMLRFRIGHRLDVAGIRFDWQMHDLPPMDWVGPTEALQVMRIVQEVLANVIKHSEAHCVRLMASHVGDKVEICISDDGKGFDTSAAPAGRGLRFLAQRAAQLGGTLSIESEIGSGTAVLLVLAPERRQFIRSNERQKQVVPSPIG